MCALYLQPSDAIFLTLMHKIKVFPFPGVPEEHVGTAAQLDPWLAEFACVAFSESMRVCFLLDRAAEIFVVTSCGKNKKTFFYLSGNSCF